MISARSAGICASKTLIEIEPRVLYLNPASLILSIDSEVAVDPCLWKVLTIISLRSLRTTVLLISYWNLNSSLLLSTRPISCGKHLLKMILPRVVSMTAD